MALDFIVFNDLHLADKPPLGRREGYREEGLAMLRECVELANEHECYLVSTGDLFHIKRGQHVSDWLKREIIAILNELKKKPLLFVVGNHDMGTRGVDSIPSQPLGILVEAGVVWPFVNAHIPRWVLVSRPYDMHRDANPQYFALTPEELERINPAKAVAIIAHGSIIPPGQQRPYPTVTSTDIDMTGINLLLSGHIHEDLGIHPRPGVPIKVFANVGALGRCSRTEANMTRTVKALGVKLQGSELILHELPLKSALPAEDIFIEHTVSDIDSDEIAAVVAQLAATDLGLEGASFADALRGLGLSPELEALATRYLEDADAERS